jgi:hypothetical protein
MFLKKYFFPNCRFWIGVFASGKQFLPNFKPYSNRPLCPEACCQKSGGLMGDFFELFGFKRVKSAFSRNWCAVNITTEVWHPLPRS